jgi:monofunctional biosynthetic peptidoglycan transglycosylase
MVKSTWRRTVARVLLGLMLLAGLPLGVLAFYWLVTFPDVARLAKTNPPTTALMDARLVVARKQGRQLIRQWTWVPLAHISPHLQRAVIVAEDATFYQHEGFDWEGIKQAVLRNFETGMLLRGGSTITQQVAKNLYLSSDKNLLRKVHEALITRALEHDLTKNRILEIYLNVAEWGQGVYGAEAAARHHFRKSALDLTADEAALLAAMLPSPQRHDPLRITPYLAKRQQQILSWMARRVSDTSRATRE